MRRTLILLLITLPLLALLYYVSQPGPEPEEKLAESGPISAAKEPEPPSVDSLPKKAVLDITVHTIDELKHIIDNLTCESINDYLAKHPPSDFTIVTLGAEKLETSLAVPPTDAR